MIPWHTLKTNKVKEPIAIVGGTGAEGLALALRFARAGAAVRIGSRSLERAETAARQVMDPKFSTFAIYEHCLPFNVSRAFDEASGIEDPVIWTDQRDREMWAALQGE